MINTPDGVEDDIKPDDSVWEKDLIVAAYCYLATLYNSSDASETNKKVNKKGPIPNNCPKGDAFRVVGIS